MKNKNNFTKEIYGLFCGLILLVIIGLVIFAYFPGNAIAQTVIMYIGGFLLLYLVLRFVQNRELNKNLEEVSSLLNSVAEDLSNETYLLNKNPRYVELFKQIGFFREGLIKREHDRQRILDLVDSIAVNIEIEKLLDDLMPKLMSMSNSQCCAFYIANNITDRLEIKASLGFNKNLYSEFDITVGEGIVGSAAKSKETQIISDIPEDTIYSIRSVIGKIKPKSMMMVPIINGDRLLGIMVFASVYNYTPAQVEQVETVKYYISVALSNGLAYEKTKRLTNELSFQNKLIQSLNDELEKSVLERTNLMNAVLDSIKNEAIYALDNEYKFLAWNTCAEETLGYKAEDVIGKHVNVIFPEEIVKTGKVRDLYEKAARNGRNAVNYMITNSIGENVFIEMLVFARYDAAGNPEGFTTVTKDITYLTKHWVCAIEEDIMTQMLRQSEKAVMYVDSAGKIICAGKAAWSLLGAESADGSNICDYFDNSHEFMLRIENMNYTSNYEQWRQGLKNSSKCVRIGIAVMLSPKSYEKMIFVELTEDKTGS